MQKRFCTAVLLGTLLASSPALGQSPTSPSSGTRTSLPTANSPTGWVANRSFGEAERLPKVADGNLLVPPIMAATTNIEKIGNGSAPKPFRTQDDSPKIDLPNRATNEVQIGAH